MKKIITGATLTNALPVYDTKRGYQRNRGEYNKSRNLNEVLKAIFKDAQNTA